MEDAPLTVIGFGGTGGGVGQGYDRVAVGNGVHVCQNRTHGADFREDDFHYIERVKEQFRRAQLACSSARTAALEEAAAVAMLLGFTDLKNKLGMVGGTAYMAVQRVREDAPLRQNWPGYRLGELIDELYERCDG